MKTCCNSVECFDRAEKVILCSSFWIPSTAAVFYEILDFLLDSHVKKNVFILSLAALAWLRVHCITSTAGLSSASSSSCSLWAQAQFPNLHLLHLTRLVPLFTSHLADQRRSRPHIPHHRNQQGLKLVKYIIPGPSTCNTNGSRQYFDSVPAILYSVCTDYAVTSSQTSHWIAWYMFGLAFLESLAIPLSEVCSETDNDTSIMALSKGWTWLVVFAGRKSE